MMLAPLAVVTLGALQSAVTISVDATRPTKLISPYIYGHNAADFTNRHKRLTLGRVGGNRMTAYNWETNASNAGSDWYHQNDSYLGGGEVPGEVMRSAVAKAFAAKAGMVITVPMAGYVSADKNGGGDVNQTPDYLNVRFHKSYPSKGSAFSDPPNLTDKAVYQDEFVWWLEKKFPNRPAPIFYCLDNEPDLWASTHARIHPSAVRYDEMAERTENWAKGIKAVAPSALVFGPVSYGWNGFTTLQDAPDRNGRDFLNFYLQQLAAMHQRNGKRLVDVLDLHWYPEAQGGGVRITETGNAQTADARVQAPRSLWDSTYVETSWITQWSTGMTAIRLIPRMMEKIQAHYPGTRLSITEYNYGAPNDISGAVAQADVLGIFGREGVFAATYWPLGGSTAYVDAAFDIYRDYDGQGAAFGNRSVTCTSTDHARVSGYAAFGDRTSNRFTMVLVNKSTSAQTVALRYAGLTVGTVRRFELSSALNRVVSKGAFNAASSITLPARSVTLLESPQSSR